MTDSFRGADHAVDFFLGDHGRRDEDVVDGKAAIAQFEAGSRDEAVEWGIQVGAYATEIRAQRSIALARGHLNDLLTGADAAVEPLDRRTGTIFRARLFGLSEQEARSACLSLKRRQLPCVPVPGRDDIELAAGPKG